MECWRPWSPLPKSADCTDPEISLAVFVKAQHPLPKTSVLSVAFDYAIAKRAKIATRRPFTHPNGSFVIFNEGASVFADLRVVPELAVFPAGKSPASTNPKRAVARNQQPFDEGAWELFASRRFPSNGANAVEAI